MPGSPRITRISWGEVVVGGAQTFKDVKLWPGGCRAWDWRETGTRHAPGVQLADVAELLDHGAGIVVLSRGMSSALQVPDGVVTALTERGVEVHVLPTNEATALYDDLAASGAAVGALIHSTC